jgi:DNA mismatch repair protein MutS
MLTPIRRQYLAIKKQYPDAILLFRMGDFYETFDEDARIMSRELEIVLTSREAGKGQRVPLAGIPCHAADNYIARLINRGYKVAVCEQLVDPATVKGIVPREVVRVITPGTVVEPQLLTEKRNNYLASLILEDKAAGLAYVDVTTGEFAATQLQGEAIPQQVQQELARVQPAECLFPGEEARLAGRTAPDLVKNAPPWFPRDNGHITPLEPRLFELEVARQALLDHFAAATLDGFGCAGKPLAVQAAGAIVQYLAETQKAALSLLSSLAVYSTDSFMVLDPATRRNLEITQSIRTGGQKSSLLGVLDATRTAMGGRLLRRWINQPLLGLEGLRARQEAVAAFYEGHQARQEVISKLGKINDLERLTSRMVQGIATPRDLVGLKATLEMVPELDGILESLPGRPFTPLGACPEAVQLLGQAIVPDPPASLGEGGVICSGFSAELDNLRLASKNAREWIANLERLEREKTGIKSLKVGYNKVFGYYIEVTNPNLHLVPENYLRKQTLVGAERYLTPELKEYEALILNAQDRMVELETQIYRQVLDQLAALGGRLKAMAVSLAEIDVYSALAQVAVRNGYVRPELDLGDEIRIAAGRHPVVEQTLTEEPFVPNDAYLSNSGSQLIVLTGPNMAGKSTYLRQVALIVLMAQIGSFVPANSATIGLVDRIFTRVGAQDDIATGQSTFMVEMVETANILHNATSRSLIVLDEIGRGTSTYDGLAIARAVAEYIHNHPRLGAKTLFATHYHELTGLAQVLPRVRNFNVAVAEEGGKVVFLRRIVPGGVDRSYGIHVAQLAGLPRSVTRRAEEVLQGLENGQTRGAPRWRSVKERAAVPAQQLPLFAPPHQALDALKKIDVLSLSPLEALTKLYELQQLAKEVKMREAS